MILRQRNSLDSNAQFELFLTEKKKGDTLRKEFADALSVAGTIQNRLSSFEKAGKYYERELSIKEKISLK